MCRFPLFETLAVVDGQFRRVEYHQQRVNFAFQHYFKAECRLVLRQIPIPTEFQHGFFRCRMDYNASDFAVGFYPYQPRKIEQFQCVYTENLDYRFKYSDRKGVDFGQKMQNVESIIVNNGKVSDCTIGNLLLLKNGVWYSPADYLLKGTQLSYLLDQKQVVLTEICPENLFDYQQIMLINALNPFELSRAIPINRSAVLI
ncbi:MAG: aminotransferase class IV family protein [Pasteurellaceae bacterium]|nr:aminotransferase class IV family protein [Pasteurellaceae bacterium]